jgi:NitT/TauT family transport system substrate-binding protein
MKYAQQMYKTGVIKTLPSSWKDAFFQTAHGLPGS